MAKRQPKKPDVAGEKVEELQPPPADRSEEIVQEVTGTAECNDFSDIDFTNPEIRQALRRAYRVLLKYRLRRLREAARKAES